MKKLGAAVLAAWAAHVGHYLVARHDPYVGFWTCNVAALMLAAGCLSRQRRAIAIGASWLVYGLPVWIIGLLSGDELVATSVVIHVGGLLAGVIGVRTLGFPRGTWWRSTATVIFLLCATRLFTPPRENVNLVFSVYPGWEEMFPTWRGYFVFLISTGTLTFAAVEAIAVKLLAKRTAAAPASGQDTSPPVPAGPQTAQDTGAPGAPPSSRIAA